MGIKELKEFISDPPEAHGFASHLKQGLALAEAKKIIELLEKKN